MENISISLQDLMLFVIFCLVIFVCVFLVIALRNLNNILKGVNKVLTENEQSITKTVALMPELVENVNDITASVKKSVDKAETLVGTVEEVITETAATVSEKTENFFDIVKIASEVVSIILNNFTKSSKRD